MSDDEKRAAAKAIVADITERIGPHDLAGVSDDDARSLLGNEVFARMIRDPLRKHGPAPGFIYPWNVVDYLVMQDVTGGTDGDGLTQTGETT